MIQLEPQHLEIVKRILKQLLPQCKALVFGSRVTLQFKPHSDLDLCIVGAKPLALSQLAMLREAFSASDLPMRVDIVVWSTLTPEFQEIIEKNSVLIV